jgi:hypothetical protein
VMVFVTCADLDAKSEEDGGNKRERRGKGKKGSE